MRMDDIKNDPRFSHILSDPRFRPMPTSKRKVKIDSRFQSLFTSKHFSHRTDIDKRGKPVLDVSKKNKHVMERFYELSSGDEEDESDESNASLIKKPALKEKNTSAKAGNKSDIATEQSNESNPLQNLKRKHINDASSIPSQKKRKRTASKPANDKKKQEKCSALTMDENSFDDSDSTENKNDKEEKESNSDEKCTDDDSDDNEDAEDGDDSDLPEFTQEYAIEETEVDHKWNELHLDAPPAPESTHRLAVCNMDWDFVKAQDLFVLFKSFVPEGGRLKSVTIYPSEFGKERMAEEARLGPKEIREQVNENSKNSDVDEQGDGKRKKKKSVHQHKQKLEEKEKKALQTEKLREYQLNRLRYYYAVVDCDSVHTADVIYNECDGREYLLSSVRLDLRFIPDDMTFDEEAKEQFAEDQSIIGYQPNLFNSTALSQANVDVTWDETDFDRLSKRFSGMQPKELESIVEENKYADIIAPPESDSEEDIDGRPAWLNKILTGEEKEYTEEEKIQMYRKLLMDKLEEEEEEKKKEEEEVDKEIEWQPGLKSSVEIKMKKKQKKKEDSALVSEYLEKKKEKKRKKREKKKQETLEKNEGEGEQAFSDDDIPDDFDTNDLKEMVEGEPDLWPLPKKEKKKMKKKKRENADEEVDEKTKAELELMLMDDNDGKHIAKPVIIEGKANKKKKLAKLKKSVQEAEDFVLDVNDPRFSALYTSHHFHIDPNAPQFKKTKNMVKLVDEQIKRKNKVKKVADETLETQRAKSVSQSLVESLKKKMKK